MQIPLTYADAVIGASGTNISYIRRASGASITIQETRGVPGEMTVEISGTSSQIQAAQQLVQVFDFKVKSTSCILLVTCIVVGKVLKVYEAVLDFVVAGTQHDKSC